MRRINIPQEVAADVFINCISIVRNANLKLRLTACAPLVTQAQTEFLNKVTTGRIHTIRREILVNGDVTSKELEDVYTLRMAKKSTPGRILYDKILMTAPYGICPLCSEREATTIDHYLPKTLYPRLSVVPVNLVPACKDCNTIKFNQYPRNANEETIHPYFDNIEVDSWLSASVLQTAPVTFQFFVDGPGHWEQRLVNRVKHHFKSLSLAKLYSVHAASELRQINFRLNEIHVKSGGNGVKSYLAEGAQTRSHDNINSWQAVFYRAAAADNWFCNGGFGII